MLLRWVEFRRWSASRLRGLRHLAETWSKALQKHRGPLGPQEFYVFPFRSPVRVGTLRL